MMHRSPIARSVLALALIVLAGVSAPTVAPATTWPTAGWPTAAPEEMGMDPRLLAQARDFALSYGLGAGLITRGGRVVMSWGTTTARYELKSTTKSIGATLLGLAIEDGLVALSDPALGHWIWFGVPPSGNADTGWLDDVTLEQLALHTAGFEKEGGYADLFFEPGSQWSYSDGGTNWLADVLTLRFGQDLRAVLFERVLSPMGVTGSELSWRDHQHREPTLEGIPRRELASGISASVDAMARIGYLYLREGQWEESQILAPSFVEAARTPAPSLAGVPVADPTAHPNATRHYGLLWWNNGDGALPDVPTDAYWSWGLGESFIIVIPSLDVVIARVGEPWQPGFTTNYSIIAPFLTPIARSVVGPATSAPAPVPAGLSIERPRANPFARAVTLVIRSDRRVRARMEVYDVHGRRIRKLLDGQAIGVGHTPVVWDGLTDGGGRAASGVYVVQVESGGRVASRRVTLLK